MDELNSALRLRCVYVATRLVVDRRCSQPATLLGDSENSTQELEETRVVLGRFREGMSLFGRVLPETDPARSHRALSLPLRHCLRRSMFQLSVPDYQRKYEWTEVNVRKLLNDLKRSLEHGDRCYSVGAPVFMVKTTSSQSNGPLEAELLDSQQRLTTLSIIYGVVSALMNDLGKAENPHVKEVEDRFVYIIRGKDDDELVHLLTLQDVGDIITQKQLFLKNIVPLFKLREGPGALQRIL